MSILISAIAGNSQKLDGGAMFGNAPKAVWERWLKPDENNRIPLACRALLIEDGNQRILCETGIGAFFNPTLAERYGVENPTHHLLMENLSQLGLSDADIDYVILSHLHFDHAGGLLDVYREGQAHCLRFPKARFLVGKSAWERARSPHARDRASFIPELPALLEKSGRLEIIESNRFDSLPRIEFLFSEGHTPGHMHTLFQGEKQRVFFAGDLIPGTAWLHIPITMGYDRFPEKLIDEKTAVYQRALSENWLLFYTHDPEWVASEVTQGEKQKMVPRNARRELKRVSL